MPRPPSNLTPEEERLLWEEAARRLSRIDLAPPVTTDEIDQVLDQLPGPQSGESLIDRLRRASRRGSDHGRPFAMVRLDELGDGHVLLEDTEALRLQLQRFSIGVADDANDDLFASLTDVPRLAAADSGSESMPVELDLALESEDGRFRIRIRRLEAQVELGIEALGLAVDEVAGRRVGLFAFAEDGAGEV